jgi:Mycothiol maleylpyruvate isomerase N-terminal domain
MTSIARLYRDAQSSMVALLESLDDDDWATPVPCTPGWTVRDVLSHVAGVTDDIANGRVEGAGTDPWTSAQVERWRDVDPTTLIAQWNSQIDAVADLLEQFGEVRPPIDCWSHEQDVRHALGREPSVPDDFAEAVVARFGAVPVGPPVTITFTDGTQSSIPGEGDAIELGGITQYEFARSRLGRRTREQVAGYDWSQPPSDEVLSNWFAFGPAELPIVEAASRWG